MSDEPTISLIDVTGHPARLSGHLHAVLDELAALTDKCHKALDTIAESAAPTPGEDDQ